MVGSQPGRACVSTAPSVVAALTEPLIGPRLIRLIGCKPDDSGSDRQSAATSGAT